MRQVSQEGIELIKRFEGLELQAYQDVAGIWTIGYGHTGPEVGPGMSITPQQAEQLLIEDLERFEPGVSEGLKVNVTQSQFDALVSLSYNIGVSAFQRSTALKRINKGDFEGAAEAITWWNKATINGRKQPVLGLTRRRSAEAALFLQDVHDDSLHHSTNGVEIIEASPRRSNPMNSRTVGGATTAGAGGAVAAGAAAMNGRDGSDDGAEGQANGESGEGGDVIVVEGDVDQDTPGEQTADASDGGGGAAPAGTGGCYDRETGEYLTPPEAEAGEPLSEGGPIEADAAPEALEEVDPPYCDELEGTTGVVVQNEPEPQPTERDAADAVGIGAGALAVLAAIYTIAARIDDWVKFRR